MCSGNETVSVQIILCVVRLNYFMFRVKKYFVFREKTDFLFSRNDTDCVYLETNLFCVSRGYIVLCS